MRRPANNDLEDAQGVANDQYALGGSADSSCEAKPLRTRPVNDDWDTTAGDRLCGVPQKRAITILVVAFAVVMAVATVVLVYLLRDRHPAAKGTGALVCDSPFGTVVGTAFGVDAKSNCNDDYTSDIQNYANAPLPNGQRGSVSTYAGMQYQCVEYARRFLITSTFALGVTFGDVVGASDIFAIGAVPSIFNKTVFVFESHNNSVSTSPPAPADLIIYPVQPGGFPYGHVAVVAWTNATHLGVAEQNWYNGPWAPEQTFAHGRYSRVLGVSHSGLSGAYTIVDHAYQISGWKRVGAQTTTQ